MPLSWIGPAVSVATSLFGASQQRKAAQTQADAATSAAQLQYQQYLDSVERQKPFYEAGVNALPELVAASRYKPFGMDQFQQDPGYAFRLAEGQKALERSAAARGGLISGGALKAATRYGQDMGSQEYTNAFNRYQAERAATLKPLQSLAGMSQTSAETTGNLGANAVNQMGQDYMGAANARASGYIGTANTLTKGINNLVGSFTGKGFGGGGGGAGVGYANAAGINPASGEYFGSLEF